MTPREELETLRDEIDAIDAELLGWFQKRMRVAERVAQVKARGGMPITDEGREQELADSAAARVDSDLRWYARSFVKSLMSLSRQRQSEIVPNTPAVAFIGMPGCGKSEVSKRVAKLLRRPWRDSDEEVEREAGMSIREIFLRQGETRFRELESACLGQLLAPPPEADAPPPVIATGGGAVLRNAALLKERCVVVYVRRNIGLIAATLRQGGGEAARPLLGEGAKSLYALYEERRPMYESLCDIAIDNDGSIDSAAAEAARQLSIWAASAKKRQNPDDP